MSYTLAVALVKILSVALLFSSITAIVLWYKKNVLQRKLDKLMQHISEKAVEVEQITAIVLSMKNIVVQADAEKRSSEDVQRNNEL